MNISRIDPFLVLVLLLNFYCLATSRVRAAVWAVAAQGILLGAIYPTAHGKLPNLSISGPGSVDWIDLCRLLGLAAAMIGIKGIFIPRMLLKAIDKLHMQEKIESRLGTTSALLIGAIGSGLCIVFARRLPLNPEHTSALIVPSALATLFVGFLLLTTQRTALMQVLGYVVLENGIFLFGLLLVDAMPIMVELGVLLDLFVGVFVMGIIIHHVSREFPSASSEHLSLLRE